MKYSIIIPFRDRFEHLAILLPKLHQHFAGTDHEIIVSEQNDAKPFRRGNTRNVGALHADGDVLIFHDVDYFPIGESEKPIEYFNPTFQVFLPVKRVEFVYNDLSPKPAHEVPTGYRHFKISVDDDFYGGALAFTRDAFFAVNGFSWKFVGWGFEDADLRERVHHYQLSWKRHSDNRFFSLDHSDSAPSMTDANFQNNISMWRNWKHYLQFGLNDMPYQTRQVSSPAAGVDKWLKSTGFTPEDKRVVISSFNFDEGEE